MKKLLYIIGGSLLLVLTFVCAAAFAGPIVASAHSTSATPTTQSATTAKHEEHPLREFVRNHKGEVVEQLAPQLHLTDAQLIAKLQSGEHLGQIAKEQGVSRESLKALLIQSVDTVVNQQVSAGKLDQSHATLLKTLVQKYPFAVAHVLHHQYGKK